MRNCVNSNEKVGLEINTVTIKYVSMFHHQDRGQNHGIKAAKSLAVLFFWHILA
jgi:hypothetical protein